MICEEWEVITNNKTYKAVFNNDKLDTEQRAKPTMYLTYIQICLLSVRV